MCKLVKGVLSFITVSERERERREGRDRPFCFRSTPPSHLPPPSPLPTHPPRPPPPPQVLGAAAVVAIVALKLQHFSVDAKGVTIDHVCWLSGDAAAQPPCTYAYTVAGVSIAAALAMSIILCCTCDLCGCGAWLDAAFEGGAAAWWGVAAGVFHKGAAAADAAGLPSPEWRQRLLYVAYGEVAVFALLAVVSVGRGLAKCCGGGRD
jgi:hypothetical protein